MDNELLEKKTVFYVDKIRNVEHGGFEFPVSCEIDPSNICNLDCHFCMFKDRSKTDLMSWDSYCWLLYELAAGGTKSITFTGGGEPLCHPQINFMIEKAVNMGFELGLVTNGALLDKVDNVRAFKFIRVSLDAADYATYLTVKGKPVFKTVVENIRRAVAAGAHVGLSYVVTKINKYGLDEAKALAENLGVMYIQFKPDVRNENVHFLAPEGEHVIQMERFYAQDMLPCQIAGLIGIVGADEMLYYCCQYRGNQDFALGKLREAPLKEILLRRNKVRPDVSKCPRCRYMNYAVSYKRLVAGGLLFYDHRAFL